jgi:antitoxin PrlF
MTYLRTYQEAAMADETAIFTGAITTTGRSEALRLEKSFFRANPEFRQRAKVTARVVGPGHVLVAVENEPLEDAGQDPVVTAFLSFLERDMLTTPGRLSTLPSGSAGALAKLLEGVEVNNDDRLPDEVTF